MGGKALSRYVGERFGYLTVIDTFRKEINGRMRGVFTVACDCGTIKDILSHNATQGKTKSCGCRTSEFKGWNVRHGLHDTRLYRIYTDMRQRCLNPNNARYHRYGGRGIGICQEWLGNFTAFYEWSQENGYSAELTIERVDNDGNYTPSNCKWATMAEQLRNRDTSRMGRSRVRENSTSVSE